MAKTSRADFTKRGRRLDLTDRIINSLYILLIMVSISVFASKLNLSHIYSKEEMVLSIQLIVPSDTSLKHFHSTALRGQNGRILTSVVNCSMENQKVTY